MHDTIDVGTRLELMVDETFLAERSAVELRLHEAIPREVSLLCDRPWEGNMSAGFMTVFADGSLFRMYYKAWSCDLETRAFGPISIAYAESTDGVHWQRPDLDVIDTEAIPAPNNAVLTGIGPDLIGTHGFAPFLDENPYALPDARYKAMGAKAHKVKDGLFALQSQDGLHWELLADEPVITAAAFDSQNLAFWDSVRNEYRAYVRDFTGGEMGVGLRGIKTCTSPDFVHWTEPEWLDYGDAAPDQLYTNMVMPYPSAPHIFVGFPTRYVERPWSDVIERLPELEHRRLRSDWSKRYGAAVSDGLFMASRDGRHFRRDPRAFIRPGSQLEGNWAYGDNYQGWGMLETKSHLAGAPAELSFYVTESYWREPGAIIRRYTLRRDGFVSASAGPGGGQFTTPALTFTGNELRLNVSTSAAGSFQVEVQDRAGVPINGLGLKQSPEMFGDDLTYPVFWRSETALGDLQGQPIKLRFVLQDADLYAFQFVNR